MKPYDHKKIEKKWQKIWEKKKLDRAIDNSPKPKFYPLIEFPFPSGDGLHVGHIRSNTAMDVIARKRRAEGYNVLYPIGWDAFGLPTENYAIKVGKQPSVITKENTDIFRRQLKALGFSFDWSREINTTDPAYYKWTQWIFLKFLEKGLAYKKKMAINWCPKDKIGLANEEVIDGKCERCGTAVEKREKEQWMLAITKYADRLDKDLDEVDFLPQIKQQQRNWIGKSEGAEIEFGIENYELRIKVFTTRPDTLFGVTYLVLAPEVVYSKFKDQNSKLQVKIENWKEVEDYIDKVKKKTEIERTDAGKEKTGIKLEGVWAINPASKEKIPVFVADYVLADYGTGAVMAVPAHDERDFEFAKKYNVPIKEVIIPKVTDVHDPPRSDKKTVERKAIQAIVVNPKDRKVLCLRWKKFPWTTFVTGGIENNEDIVTAAKREIFEETGYKNVTYIRTLGGPVESHFFANHKDENRKALFYGLIFELGNEERQEISENEKAIHDIHWMTWDEIKKDKNTKCAEYDIWFDRYFNKEHAWTESGILVDSGKFDGRKSEEVKKEITEFVGGKMVTTYKLRDWIFSRQRYWGEPIPVINCPTCGLVPVPEKDLPVELPKVKNYMPTDSGESPLASISKWVNVKCPKCKGKAKRETDTMPNWAGSSWYYLRYIDPKSKKVFVDPEKLAYWSSATSDPSVSAPTLHASRLALYASGPVDWYNGGMEHTTLHLLYSRFWHKFLYDLGLVGTSEPYAKRTSHGLILAEGGEKMSKSKGNTISPDAVIENVGADTLRVYEMFMGPFDQPIAWSTDNMVGSRRFLERVWKLGERIMNNELGIKNKTEKEGENKKIEQILNQTIKKVGEDIEAMKFNTAISQMMIFLNALESESEISTKTFATYIRLLAPFAPHITDELWSELGNKNSIHLEPWPTYDESKLISNEQTIVIQVNGKNRAELVVKTSLSEEKIKELAEKHSELEKWLSGKEIVRVIYVKGRLVNFVVKLE